MCRVDTVACESMCVANSCQQYREKHPKCKEIFEDTIAVKWFLNSLNIFASHQPFEFSKMS